jgi:hypothetical protein
MKFDITPTELSAIMDMADDIEASIGINNEEYNKAATRQVKLFDSMLKRNNLSRKRD